MSFCNGPTRTARSLAYHCTGPVKRGLGLFLGIGNGVGGQGRGNQPPYRRYGPDTEIQYRLREPHGLAKTSRILSKREADTEFQYRPHIVDTDTGYGRHFCGTQVFFLFYTAEAQFAPGTSPVCPKDIPGTKGGRQSLCVKSLCAFFVPYRCLAYHCTGSVKRGLGLLARRRRAVVMQLPPTKQEQNSSPAPEVYNALRFPRSLSRACMPLKTLTSLNKEVTPFFLSDNSTWSFPSVSSLSDYSIWRY